jgi:hypothetical protein
MTKQSPVEALARHLVYEAARQVRFQQGRWAELSEIARALHVSWGDAQAAAQFAAAAPRDWIAYKGHSVMVREAGQLIVDERVRKAPRSPS